MKRLALLTVLLLVVGLAMGFGLDFKPTIALSGNMAMTWGVDLDGGHTGFANAPDSEIKVSLIAEDTSDTHAGTGDIYASIKISNIELFWTDGTQTGGATDAPSASIFFLNGMIELGLNAPGMEADDVAPIEDAENNDPLETGIDAIDNIVDTEASLTTDYPGNGTVIAYHDPGKLFSVALDVKSEFADTDNTADGYAIGVEPSVTLGPATITAGVFKGFNYTSGNPIAAFGAVEVKLEGVGTFGGGVDLSIPETSGTTGIEIGVNAQLNFNKDATAFLQAKAIYNVDPAHMDGLIYFIIPSNTLMGAFNADAVVYALDLASSGTSEFAAAGHVGYKISLNDVMYVKPLLSVGYGIDAGVNVTGGVVSTATTSNIFNLAPALEVGLCAGPAATMTVGYTSGNLMATTVGMGEVFVQFKVTY
jgi:hypothetical protein